MTDASVNFFLKEMMFQVTRVGQGLIGAVETHVRVERVQT